MLALMDWDEDGKLDLIAGNAIENFDGLRWYRTSGRTSSGCSPGNPTSR